MLLLGIDLGSSSVKASVVDGDTGSCLGSGIYPKEEMKIIAVRPGWAEQDPEDWWINLKSSVSECLAGLGKRKKEIGAIGISYQMHGLVGVDKQGKPVRPSIIWCDSRAVPFGEKAFEGIGREYSLTHLLNSPGNFTAAKLAWVRENEPAVFDRIDKILLPGDFIAMKLTGEKFMSLSGLSEGIFWDFIRNDISAELMTFFGFDKGILPDKISSFSVQGTLVKKIALELGLNEGIPVSYRAGDQPNNALSLNVLEPGEVAATAGTSGVIYGVTDQKKYDPQSRVNTFLHVNNSLSNPRMGVLLCINGTGILNSWLRKNTGGGLDYDDMNAMASDISVGAEGISVLPFGNGAERMLMNREVGCRISGLDFNRHSRSHLFRAGQEGIGFAFRYGLDIMKETGIDPSVIRAGEANMLLSPVFREVLSCITGSAIQLYNTDGSVGAARGAGIGCGFYNSPKEAFVGLKTVGITEPDPTKKELYNEAYRRWKDFLTLC